MNEIKVHKTAQFSFEQEREVYCMSNVIHNQGHRFHVLSRRDQVIRHWQRLKSIRQQIVSHYSSSRGAGNKGGGKAINKSIATLRASFCKQKSN